MPKKYEIVSIENRNIFLRDIETREYRKADYRQNFIGLSKIVKDQKIKPLFNYYFNDEIPDLVILGAPINEGSRLADSTVSEFPDLIRQESYKLKVYNYYQLTRPITFYDINENRKIDCGKICDLGNVRAKLWESAYVEFKKTISFCTKKRIPFILIGGNHMLAYYSLKALDHLDRKVVVWDFDAHNDLYSINDKADHGNVFARVADMPHIEVVLQFGSRGIRTRDQLTIHEKVKIISKKNSSSDVILKFIDMYSDYYHYISIDFDCLDPKVFPYVDFPVEQGFETAEVLNLMNTIMTNVNVIGMDLVEGNGDGKGVNGSYSIPLRILIEAIQGFNYVGRNPSEY